MQNFDICDFQITRLAARHVYIYVQYTAIENLE